MMLDQHLNQLSKVIGSRGSATHKEKRAALYARDVLSAYGYKTNVMPFKGLTTFSWLYIVFYVSPLIAWIFNFPALSVLSLTLFFLDLNTFPVLSRIFPKRESQNVHSFNPENAGRKVVVVAHLDSSKAGLNFSPALVKGFRTSFLIMVSSMIVSPVFLILSLIWHDFMPLRILALIPCLYLLFVSLMLLHREIWNKYTDGANDNASGVAAVLALAQRCKEEVPNGVDLQFLLTGCEESGTYGMIDFLDKYGEQYKDTFFVNLDNIGSGNLYYMSGEGMFPVYKASSELIDACATVSGCRPDLNVKQGVYNLLSTDAMPLLARKYKAISFLALDDEGLLPNWHWPTDTYENVDIKTVETAVEFVFELIKEIGRKSLYETRHLRNTR